MLRDLGQMVAEAERLGPVATVTAPPSPLPAAPPTPVPASAVGRSPFDILGGAPAAPAPRSIEDDLATREVVRPLPATAFVAATPPAAPGPDGDSRGSSEHWHLDEPTRSRKSPPPPPDPAPEEGAVDVDASLPGPEVAEPPSPPPARPRGLAVSPFDGVPSAPGLLEERPEGATEIIKVAGLPAFSAAADEGLDRPTEILKPIAPPVAVPEAAPPAPPAPKPAEELVDRPTEILRAIVPPEPVPAPMAPAPPALPAPPEAFVDRPTEILQAIPPPAFEKPAPPALAGPAAARPRSGATVGGPAHRDPAQPVPVPGRSADLVPRGLRGGRCDGTDRRRPEAGQLGSAREEAPAAGRAGRADGAGPEAGRSGAAPRKPVSAPALRAQAPPPPAAVLPPVELAPIPEPAAKPAEPPMPLMKRSINSRFVALIIGLVVIAGAITTWVLWSKKAAIDAQAGVDEVREREVQELKSLMDEGNRLLAAGTADQALEKFREVIRRKPDSIAAREALTRAEELYRSRLAGEERNREVQTRLGAAREAAEQGELGRALDELSAVLLLEPENADALAIRDSVKAAQAEKTAAEKKAAAELARKKKPTPVPTPVRAALPVVPVEAPKAATPTPASARLRIVFQSPAPEGYVMIRRNDKEVFRRQFDFGRKSAGGLVEGTIEVPSGPASIKAWTIPTNRSFNGYEAVELVIPGGETRSLVLELNAANKLVVSLR